MSFSNTNNSVRILCCLRFPTTWDVRCNNTIRVSIRQTVVPFDSEIAMLLFCV